MDMSVSSTGRGTSELAGGCSGDEDGAGIPPTSPSLADLPVQILARCFAQACGHDLSLLLASRLAQVSFRVACACREAIGLCTSLTHTDFSFRQLARRPESEYNDDSLLLRLIEQTRSLQAVSLRGSQIVTDKHVVALVGHNKDLQELDLTFCVHITPAVFQGLLDTSNRGLQELHLAVRPSFS
mmetsp:Transcript_27867/g.78797  ORF Transcript_27867/g.78797 Transcript_27867/m.78797 type:complete len:184 (-) Transcript_27867:2365-2916(-)